jgi:hypothetical protein
MLAARLVGNADETEKWAQLLLAQMEKDECGSSVCTKSILLIFIAFKTNNDCI